MINKKPEDYLTYFNQDDSEKENPYFNTREGITDLAKGLTWANRQKEIKCSFMSYEERLSYEASIAHILSKMQS